MEGNMAYIILFFVVVTIAIPIDIIGRRHIYSYICLVLIITILSLFSGLRYGVGTDYHTYVNIFDKIFIDQSAKDSEPLFYYLTATIRIFTDNSQVFFIVTSIIINLFIVLVLYKKSIYFTFSIFLYLSMGFYFVSFNILRQYMAIAIALYIINNKYKISKINIIIGSIIAMGLHTTSVIILFLLLFKKGIDNKRYIIIFSVISLISLIFEPILTNLLLSGKYEVYGETNFFSYGTSIVYIIEYIALLVFYYLYSDNIKDNNKFYLMAVCIGLVFTILGMKGVLYNRMAIAFNLYNTLLIPNVVSTISNNKEKRLLIYCLYVFYLVKFFLVLNTIDPYKAKVNLIYN